MDFPKKLWWSRLVAFRTPKTIESALRQVQIAKVAARFIFFSNTAIPESWCTMIRPDVSGLQFKKMA